MKILHISVESDDGWFIAQGLEEPALITQARSLDDLLANIQEVIHLLEIGDKDLHIELILPPSAQRVHVSRHRARRLTASAPVRAKKSSRSPTAEQMNDAQKRRNAV